MSFEITPIGVIHTPCATSGDTPIQSARSNLAGRIEVFPAYREGLVDLAGFDCIWVLWLADRAGPCSLTVTPFLDHSPRGLFSTRAPSRPNPIGLSAVRLISIDGGELAVTGVDMIDGTPLLDLKPYIPSIDQRTDCAKSGWLEGKDMDRRGDERFNAPPPPAEKE